MQKIKPEPKEFLDDMEWGWEHYSEFIEKYPDKWIAIVNKRVAAVGESINEVEDGAEKKTKRKKEKIPVMFIECGGHIY
ncbi:hypothetical protein BEH94_09345 [Candidatus Altiarchaeales archaeon WOR_SM1_SCG]|nr:hypothetical protein BEH94_09345 [Candidatus Altiarchaeales archaeon WOR_SM1_SCG]